MARTPFKLVLESVSDLAPGVKHFAFMRDDGETLDFVPGQFVQMFFEHAGETVRRSYSIASVPGRDRSVDIAVSAVVDGIATRHFWALEPGDALEALGPFGRLVLRDEPAQRYCLVATGTGVTPYRAMLPQIAERLTSGQMRDVHLMFGVRTREDLLYADEFTAFADAHPGFTFTAHYSRAFPEAPEPWEKRGYVQHAFDGLGLDPGNDIVYLCGNPNMIDDAMAWLTGQGFATKQVRREKYISGA